MIFAPLPHFLSSLLLLVLIASVVGRRIKEQEENIYLSIIVNNCKFEAIFQSFNDFSRRTLKQGVEFEYLSSLFHSILIWFDSLIYHTNLNLVVITSIGKT